MIYTPPWLSIAREDALRGILEKPGPNENHERILEFHSHTSLHATTDEVPWCSSSLCCWLAESGRESTKSARARSFLNWGIRLPDSEPAFGCIAVIKRGGSSQGPEILDAPGHCALLIDVQGDYMILLGGNQENRVCERPYHLSRLLGFRWPGEKTQ